LRRFARVIVCVGGLGFEIIRAKSCGIARQN
jgi:hypothetical protein